MLTITSFKVTLETGGGTVVPLTGQILHQHQLLLSHRAADDRRKPRQHYHFSFHPRDPNISPSHTSVKADKRVQIKTFDLLFERLSWLGVGWGGVQGCHASVFVYFVLLKPKQEACLLQLLVVMEAPESISSVPEMRARGTSADSCWSSRRHTHGATVFFFFFMNASVWKHGNTLFFFLHLFSLLFPFFSHFNSFRIYWGSRPHFALVRTRVQVRMPRFSTIGHACARALRLKYNSLSEYLYSNTGSTLCTLYLTSCRILTIINCLIPFPVIFCGPAGVCLI